MGFNALVRKRVPRANSPDTRDTRLLRTSSSMPIVDSGPPSQKNDPEANGWVKLLLAITNANPNRNLTQIIIIIIEFL